MYALSVHVTSSRKIVWEVHVLRTSLECELAQDSTYEGQEWTVFVELPGTHTWGKAGYAQSAIACLTLHAIRFVNRSARVVVAT